MMDFRGDIESNDTNNNYYDYYSPRGEPHRIETAAPKLPSPRPAVREDY